MADDKKNGIAEKLILFTVFLVFAGIVVTFAFKWNYVDEASTSSSEVTSFQYVTYSKPDTVNKTSLNARSGITSEVSSSVTSVTGKININTATLEELDTLPGIGEKKAQAIIDYRENESPFLKPEDIMNVSGIGEKTYEQLKDLIVTE